MQQTEELAPVEHDEELPHLELDDIEELDLVSDDDLGEIEKEIKSTRAKPKVVRKNIEHYFEERALKRRIDDVFDDALA